MSAYAGGRPRRTGFPLGVVLAFAGCGVLGVGILLWWSSWWSAVAVPIVVLAAVGARRGRRGHGWSWPATVGVGVASALGAALVVGFAVSVA